MVSYINLAIVVSLLVGASCDVLPDGRGKTPLMGWRSWNFYADAVDQELMESVMEALVAKDRSVDGERVSLCDLGYCDVGLDDAWQACNNSAPLHYHHEDGTPIVNYKRFPDMKKMTDKAHKLGLKASWYGNNCICQESKTRDKIFYEGDVLAFANFGFDGIKLDGCGPQIDLALWNQLLQKAKPSGVVIENCHWGFVPPSKPNTTWCPWSYYRTSTDIKPEYNIMVANLQSTIYYAEHGLSRPGCWAYPDMLEVGVPGLTWNEARSHFGAWAIVSSPLVLSHDVHDKALGDKIWPIISNREVLAINQDWAGHSGSPFLESQKKVVLNKPPFKIKRVSAWQYFYKPLSDGKIAVLLMNHDETTLTYALDLSKVPGIKGDACTVRDVWERKNLGLFTKTLETKNLSSHDSAFYVLHCHQATNAAKS